MDRQKVFERLASVFRDIMDADDARLEETTTAEDVEEWDSISHVRLMLAIEKAFGVRFTTAEIGDFQNLGDIVTAVLAKKG